MQPKKPRFNPLVIAIVLAAVLMVWSVLGGTGGNANGSSMAYSTVVHYFESNQVTKFSLDLNTGVITMTLKEGTGAAQRCRADHHPVYGRTAFRPAVLLFLRPHRGEEER